MSSGSLLEILQKKPVPKKSKFVEIQMKPGQIQIQTTIVDKTDSTFDIKNFRKRLKNRELELSKKITERDLKKLVKKAVAPTVVTSKPEKLTKKKKMPGRKRDKSEKQQRKKKAIEEIVLDIPATLIEINDRPIEDRLVEKDPNIIIKSPSYYLNNREIFINFINSLFGPYSKQLKEEKSDISCDSKKSDKFSLMIHQQLVRDYMNLYTPYRGLLLYHGLGAGKTCASIGIAEGMKDNKQVIIMTPAALQMNYRSELKKCGDPLYKTNQYWEKIDTTQNKHIEKALSEVLGLSVADIQKTKGAWLVDTKKDSNYDTLSFDEQKAIDKQINLMMEKKYKFINYNGIRESYLTSMIKLSQEKDGTSNPFDNKVIIVDEAHNFVSRIVNKIKSKKKTLSIKLYELIMAANNARVIFLTGTPIVNYPNEIAILFNMLRGYIKTFYLPLDTSQTSEKINQAKIMSIFKKEPLLDYVEYKSDTLIITRNPFGFSSRYKRNGTYAGVSNNIKAQRDDNYFKNKIIRKLGDHNIEVIKQGIRIETHKALPDTLDTFSNLFIDQVSGNLKNINLFKRRILGLTSYFRSAQEALLPAYNEEKDTHLVEIPMSPYQIGVYETARAAERKEALRNAKKRKKAADGGIYGDTTSTYRIFSRAFCNYVFPNEIDEETKTLITRPMPKKDDTISSAISSKKQKIKKSDPKEGSKTKEGSNPNIDEDILDGGLISDRLGNIDGRYDIDDADKLEKETKEIVDTSYPARIKTAMELLNKNADKYLKPDGLKIYGPKFLKVLQNLQNHEYPGLHLIYSQFRTIEGIGILTLILQHNGFARFKVSKNSSSVWDLDMTEEDIGKPTFALYTGTETAEEKEVIRNIFNGTWDSLPSTLTEKLKKIAPNNNMGQIIKVLMITSSGSEGITLKNTRYVHILEPYWHPVRTDQVVGRAVRICSHNDLEEEYKTVEVFLYLMIFTDQQLYGNPKGQTAEEKKPVVSIELKLKDISKIDRKTPLTSDQALFEISRIKKNISKGILTAIKESSIDCSIHTKSNLKEGLVCYSFGNPSPNTFSYKPEYTTEEKDVVTNINKKKITWKAYPITIQGTKYALKRTHPNATTKLEKSIGEVYDLDSYKQAKKHGTNPILIYKTRINPKNATKIQVLKPGDDDF